MFADWVEVVEVEAVIGGVLRGCIVDWHSAEPADCVLCFALVEECGFVFFELAAGFAGSWHVVTAFVVLRVGVGPAWVECVVVIMVVRSVVPWLGWGPTVGIRVLSACSYR